MSKNDSGVIDRATRVVWIINDHASVPQKDSSKGRHWHLAQALSAGGWNVTLFCGSTLHPSGLDSQLLRFKASNLARVDIGLAKGLIIKTVPYRSGELMRVVSMIAFGWRTLRAGIREKGSKPRVIIGSTVHPLAALTGWVLSRFHRAIFVYEVRDLWPETLVDLGVLREQGLADRALGSINLFLARRAKAIISPLSGVGRFYAERGVVRPFAWLPNGVDSNKTYPTTLSRAESKTRFVLGYVGSTARIYAWEGVAKAFAEASASLREFRLELHLIGSGSETQFLKHLLTRFGLADRLTDFGPQKEADIADLLFNVDALILPHRNLPTFQYGTSPVKLSHYINARKPILYSSADETNWLGDLNLGFSTDWENPDASAGAIKRMTRLVESERIEISKNATRASAQLSWEKIGRDLSDFLLTNVIEDQTG